MEKILRERKLIYLNFLWKDPSNFGEKCNIWQQEFISPSPVAQFGGSRLIIYPLFFTLVTRPRLHNRLFIVRKISFKDPE
jgi:hypothetical protein